jgi:hypothetical protein
VAAISASLIALPAAASAGPHRPASHATKAAKKKARAKKKVVKNKLARAAQSEVTTGPVLHTIGVGHFAPPAGPPGTDEAWHEFSDVPRRHLKISLVPAERSIEEWDVTTVEAGTSGLLTAPLSERIQPTDIYCPSLPGGTAEHPWTWPEWNVVQVERARAERTQIEAIAALTRDAAARAALPAGPAVDGRPTVTAVVGAPVNARGWHEVADLQVTYDAATGNVVRTEDPGGYGYTEYTTWELLPAGGDAADVALPAEIASQVHCTQ